MIRLLTAAMLVGLPVAADEIDTTGLAMAAICAKQYGEVETFDAAFTLYEKQNPDGMTADTLLEVRRVLEEADTSEIEADPIASAITRGICDQARAGLLD